MTLRELYSSIGAEPLHPDTQVAGITADSRAVQPGYLFVAERGVTTDGHKYIPQALQSGAVAIVCNELPALAEQYPQVEWTLVPDSTQALGALADKWYDHPSQKLSLVGVTGTNGKTTVATLVYEMTRLMGLKAGLISTVVNKVDTREIPATHTTPDTVTLHRLMAEMVDAGCAVCAMEVSSHACHQNRIAGLTFSLGIFTNLTRDHLDYHKTFANYLAAKKSFFDRLPAGSMALTNIDDKNGNVMLQNTKARTYTYSLVRMADFKGTVVEDRLDGMILRLGPSEVTTMFTGRYNASNLTAVYGAGRLLGWSHDDVVRAISALTPVAGRMQTLHLPNGATAIVDYAHTPDAIANTLDAITEAMGHGGKITVVTGAGGDRDHGKRPLMAQEAVKRADRLVLTSDNPRSEDPAEIARQMLQGVPQALADRVVTILDRAEAIRYALEAAGPGDAVLIAGKGHENYQIIGSERRHFDDREEVLKFINHQHC